MAEQCPLWRRKQTIRRPKETICIGDDVRVTVLDIKGNQVRLGIEAPDAVPIHREEIYKKIQDEGAAPLIE